MMSEVPTRSRPFGMWRVCVWPAILLGMLEVTGVLVSWTAALLVTLGLGLVVWAMFVWGARPWSRASPHLLCTGSPSERADRRRWLGWFWILLAAGPGSALVAAGLDRAAGKGELPAWLELLKPSHLEWVVMGILGLSAFGAAGCLIRARVARQSWGEGLLLVLFCSVALGLAQAFTFFLVTWLLRVGL